MKRSMMICVATATLVLSGAGAARAGEVNGNGIAVPGGVTGKSACSFSGLDTLDSIEDPLELFPEFADDSFAVRGSQKNGYHGVQSYGSIVKAGFKAFAPSPGDACRGNAAFAE